MFTVYTASAGSGKTSRLVVEYLSLALPVPKKFKHILAITFTNNATAEMKNRILDALRSFAFQPYDQFPESLKATYSAIQANLDSPELEIPFDLYIKKQASLLLQEILYDFDNFAISTIDAFFQRILRAFSFELGLNMNYNLEIQLDDLYEQTIDLLLNKLSIDNKELSKRVLGLIENKIENTGKWKIERELTSLLQNIFNEDAFEAIKELRLQSHEKFDHAAVKVNLLKKKALKERDEAIEKYRQFIEQQQFDNKFFNKLISDLDDLTENSLDEQLEKKFKKGVPPEIESQLYQLQNLIADVIKTHDRYTTIVFFGKNISQLALLIDIKNVIDEIKEHDNLFYLSETNGTIFDQVKDEEAPYIYEKLGNKYSYFFLDEFQDTSKMQWENILPLIKNSLSGFNDFKEKGRTYIFGDVKQAIYRFRNGDSSLLYHLSQYESYKKLVNPFAIEGTDYQLENLDKNFRSSRAIVDFNNRFYSFLVQQTDFSDLEPYYKDVTQSIDEKKSNGLVSIRFKDEKDSENSTEYLLTETLKTIQEITAEGIPYGDIAVLVSANNLGSAMGEWLSQHNIPVISSDSLLLSSSQEVMVIISTLYYLINPKNKIARMIMGHYLIRSHPKKQRELFQSLEDDTLFHQFIEEFGIRFSNKELIDTPLFTLINKIISLFNITEKDPFVIMLLDKTDEFLKKSIGSIPLFLDWWDQNKEKLTLTSPSKINAVTITTIHKAKGLAYPIVILPFTQYSYAKTKNYYWIKDKEHITGLPYSWVHLKNGEVPHDYNELIEEERHFSTLDQINKLYVAQTRPKERLYLITQGKKKGNYSKLLDGFINQKISQEQKDANRYFYDGEQFYTEFDYKSEEKGISMSSNTNNSNLEISRIYVSDFQFDSQYLAFDAHKAWNEEQERGIYVHQFLSDLKRFPENQSDIHELIIETPEKYHDYIQQLLEKLIGDIEYSPYFQNHLNVLNETSIISTDGTILRPDRVIFMEDHVMVIDYKTGAPSEKHQEQIEQYCIKLQEMGYSNVMGKLLYL